MGGLAGIVWQQKWLILWVTITSLLIGSICIWNTTPLYQAKALILAPSEGDIAALNAEHNTISVKSIYRLFIQSLTSQFAQHQFSDPSKHLQLVVKEERYLLLKGHLVPYSVTAKAPTPAQAHDAVSRYIDLANKRALDNVLDSVATQNKRAIDQLTQQIELARKTAQKERDDQLIRLNEALQLASALGITTPANDSTALYMRGTGALSMEIQKIAERQSNDAYTPGLRALQSQRSSLRHAQVATANVKLFQLDGIIEVSTKPISPRKQLIVILFLILGLTLGSLLAIWRARCSQEGV